MISIQHLTKRIGHAAVLDDVSMHMGAGRITGLVGPNGSGKTILMRVIAGLVKPTSGKACVGGFDSWTHLPASHDNVSPDESHMPTIGLLLEAPAFLAGYSGYKNLEFLASIRGRIGTDEIRRALSSMGLDPDDRRKYRKYSLGMKQRLGIVAAVMERPDILLLDEPTNALDSRGVDLALEQIRLARARGATVILASHDACVMQSLADEVWYLAEGHIDGHEVACSGGV